MSVELAPSMLVTGKPIKLDMKTPPRSQARGFFVLNTDGSQHSISATPSAVKYPNIKITIKMTYQQQRLKLFFISYAASVLAQNARQKLGLTGKVSLAHWHRTLEKTHPKEFDILQSTQELFFKQKPFLRSVSQPHYELTRTLFPSLFTLADFMGIPDYDFYVFVVTGVTPAIGTIVPLRDVFVVSGVRDILPGGVYVRVRPNMTTKEISQILKLTKSMPLPTKKFARPKKQRLPDKKKLETYREIELKMITIANSNEDLSDSYGRAGLVTKALDWYVTDLVAKRWPHKEEDDRFIEKKTGQFRKHYYTVLSSFQLFPPQEVVKLFGLLKR
jgi:hypothetical protein